MEKLIRQFDERVDELIEERLKLSLDIKYLEGFESVLHQEVLVIRIYDGQEAAILKRVNNGLADKHTKHLKVSHICIF